MIYLLISDKDAYRTSLLLYELRGNMSGEKKQPNRQHAIIGFAQQLIIALADHTLADN